MRALDYFFATRPLLQLPIWTVYLVAHYSRGSGTAELGAVDLLMMFGISLLFAAAAYVNQVYDFESDRINSKLGFLQRGRLTRRAMMTGALVVSVTALILGALISITALIIFAQFLLLAWVYSTPPVRLKDRLVGGLLANNYAHGFLVAVAVEWQLPWNEFGSIAIELPLYFFLTVGATYALTTIPDIPGDAATGKRTLGVVWGRTVTAAVAGILILLSVPIAYRLDEAALVYLSLGAFFMVAATLFVRGDAAVRLAAKMPILALTLIAGYHYPLYLLFVVALLVGCRIYYRQRFGIIYPELA